MEKLIFIGGCYGVGKTFSAIKLSEALGLTYVSASSILKDKGLLNESSKNVDSVSFNQEILKEELIVFLSKHQDVVLDGHYSVFNKGGFLEPIPADFFLGLPIQLLILIINDPEVIQNNLITRDGKFVPLSLIIEMQEFECKCAEDVAEYIGKDLVVIDLRSDSLGDFEIKYDER